MIPIKTALDHADVKKLLPQLREGSLDAETLGRVQGHLDGCDECFMAFGDEIDSAIEKGLLPKLDVPPMPELPKGAGASFQYHPSEEPCTCGLIPCECRQLWTVTDKHGTRVESPTTYGKKGDKDREKEKN